MGETKRVLVVEDDESIRECVQVILEDEGYDVIEASDGAAALALLDTVWPDVILLDMLMPGMDGWAFAVAYRQRPGPHAPIVVITAARDAAARADQIDAAGVLAKPFRVEALVSCVNEITA
jgi:CheY-like chemotaxis protein